MIAQIMINENCSIDEQIEMPEVEQHALGSLKGENEYKYEIKKRRKAKERHGEKENEIKIT